MRLIKKLALGLLTVVGAFSLTACSEVFDISEDSVIFSQIGETAEVFATVGGEEVTPIITLSEEGVVSLSQDKTTLTALEDGQVTISYQYEGFDELFCVVKVDTSFSITVDSTASVASGATIDLAPVLSVPDVKYANDMGMSFVVADESIATVDSNGVVTGVSRGATYVTITSDLEITEETFGEGGVSTGFKTRNATAEVIIMVDNLWDGTTHASIVGSYSASYDWLGFGQTSGAFEDAGWVRAILTLEINADGTFTQMIVNAQRSTYSFNAETLTFANAHTYNRFNQSSSLDSAKDFTYTNLAGDTQTISRNYLDIAGYSGIPNFSESGTVFIDNDGNLQFIYTPRTTNPVTQVKELGAWATAFDTPYKPLENMGTYSENMTMLLTKSSN